MSEFFLLICKTTQKQQLPGWCSLIRTPKTQRANSQHTEISRCKRSFPVRKGREAALSSHLQEEEWQSVFLNLVFSLHSNSSASKTEIFLRSPQKKKWKLCLFQLHWGHMHQLKPNMRKEGNQKAPDQTLTQNARLYFRGDYLVHSPISLS